MKNYTITNNKEVNYDLSTNKVVITNNKTNKQTIINMEDIIDIDISTSNAIKIFTNKRRFVNG